VVVAAAAATSAAAAATAAAASLASLTLWRETKLTLGLPLSRRTPSCPSPDDPARSCIECLCANERCLPRASNPGGLGAAHAQCGKDGTRFALEGASTGLGQPVYEGGGGSTLRNNKALCREQQMGTCCGLSAAAAAEDRGTWWAPTVVPPPPLPPTLLPPTCSCAAGPSRIECA